MRIERSGEVAHPEVAHPGDVRSAHSGAEVRPGRAHLGAREACLASVEAMPAVEAIPPTVTVAAAVET